MEIETLVLLGDTSPPEWSPHELVPMGLDVMLPGLTSLAAGATTLIRLVPQRAISRIDIIEGVNLSEIPSLASKVSEASVPLVSLSVKITITDVAQFRQHLIKWMESLTHCYGTLGQLGFRVDLTSQRWWMVLRRTAFVHSRVSTFKSTSLV
ncbi:hypothetical protein FRC07_000319 [Ceratobasidium sp. 392]|nr:hypothetical protein FRC07_000319 [Ceratobasidium sp. 392]